MKWVKWVELFVAGWIFISPWILGFSEIIPALWSCVISGVIIGVIVAWELFGESASPERQRGEPPQRPTSFPSA